jgi:hypothetical protein
MAEASRGKSEGEWHSSIDDQRDGAQAEAIPMSTFGMLLQFPET